MSAVIELLETLRKSIPLAKRQLAELAQITAEPVQYGAILAGLSSQRQIPAAFMRNFAQKSNGLLQLYAAFRCAQPGTGSQKCSESGGHWSTLFSKLPARKTVGARIIRRCIRDIVEDAVPQEFPGAFLMLVALFGLSERDEFELTNAMAQSGDLFDYRGHRKLKNKVLFRRYPTGGLSEKVALILPSLIAALGDDRPVISPFLVARSLSFTGGTWDKLSSIPGFRFPQPGEETVELLAKCGIAMTVTHGEFNPADRKLYAMRSITGTVDSDPLIVSSIVSKQIRVPADLLILDVRFGEGTFLSERGRAESLGHRMCKLIERSGVSCVMTLLDTPEPNGSAIGNALEVSEAISIIKGERSLRFDPRLQDLQRQIVVDFAAKGMARLFPEQSPNWWAALCYRKFSTGEVWKKFRAILSAHKVSKQTIQNLQDDTMYLLRECAYYPVLAKRSGQISRIDQSRLGNFVNFQLARSGAKSTVAPTFNAGILLRRRLYDPVRKDDVIADIVVPKTRKKPKTQAVSSCFDISPIAIE